MVKSANQSVRSRRSVLERFLCPSLLFRASTRFFRHHPWQLGLTLLSIALGTAVVIAVDLANQSARESFANTLETVGGRMTHRIVNKQSGESLSPSVQSVSLAPQKSGIDERVYTRLRTEWGFRQSAPVVTGDIAIKGKIYSLQGFDLFAEPLFSANNNNNDSDQLFSAQSQPELLLTRSGAVFLTRDSANRIGVEQNQPFQVDVNRFGQSHQETLEVAGFLPDSHSAAFQDLLLTDIATAQQVLRKTGRLDRIELILNEKAALRLGNLLAEHENQLVLEKVREKNDALLQMSSAFHTNLTAMSLLAMLVGAFLVYNTMTFSVLQRRRQLAVERMLGVTGTQLFVHILLEAVLLGLVGALLGVVFGVLLGQGLLGLVTRTISDFYSSVDMRDLLIQPVLIAKGVGITLLAVILATLAPAREAAKIAPAQVNRQSGLESSFGRSAPWLAFAGIVLLLLSGLLLLLMPRSLIGGFVALFLLVIGYSLLVPLLLRYLLKWIAKIRFAGVIASLATRNVQASLSRTTLAIIALSIAVSATVGVGIMIHSFRATVATWLDSTLQSDLYVSGKRDSLSGSRNQLEPFWLEAVNRIRGVRSVSTGRHLKVNALGVPTPLFVLDPGQHGQSGFRFLGGNEEQFWKGYLQGQTVLVSEPFAYHHQLERGDSVALSIGQEQPSYTFIIGGIFQDYSATQGMVVMHPSLFRQYWPAQPVSSVGLLLEPDQDAAAVRTELEKLAQTALQPVQIRSNREVRAISLEVFDRTFAITDVLRLLVILVAFVGVFSALMALFLEKGRDFAVLRATGMTPVQLTTMVLLQTILIGFLAGLLALPLGWAMSEILISIINQRSFGWTMNRTFPVMVVLHAIALSTLAALLAGLYPIRRMARLSVSKGLRQ